MPQLSQHFRLAALIALFAVIAAASSTPGFAGCSATPISGGLQVECSATIPPDPVAVPIVIPAGNNEVGIISGGYVDFEILGNGESAVSVSGGTISGSFTTHDGADLFAMSAGTISGSVSQGDGIDAFTMTGGTIGSLNQGGGLDTFFMSGGTILGAFTNGDFATITGGTIGSVDMNIGNNFFFMSGGTVLGDVEAQQNNDTFVMSGGTIGGEVDLGNGTNTLTVTGGSIGNGISTGVGADTLNWSGGVVNGAISLGAGADRATLTSLGPTNLSGTTLVDGGAGFDELTFSNSIIGGVARFQNWEVVALTNGSVVTLDSNFVLGGAPSGSTTGTGSMSIDGTSILYAGGTNNAIRPFSSGQLVLVTNAGMIDLANGSVGDSIMVVGNYVGAGGKLHLDTRLGSDASPSDKLIIDSGTASGGTGIVVTNVGGAGAQTVANGILVVETQNGGATAAGAFALAAPVVAGPYEYSLYRGGVNGTDPDNWYLRSTFNDTPDYRAEVSLYTALPAMTLLYGRMLLDTLHERNGDAIPLVDGGTPNGAWGRVIGQHGDHDGHALGIYGSGPQYDYDFWALQAGADFLRTSDADGARNKAGGFLAIGSGSGNVDHYDGTDAGRDSFMAYTWGGYWTHATREGTYVDAVILGTWYDAAAKSRRFPKLTTEGAGLGASLEGGYPIRIAGGLVVEPQAQIAYQTINLHDASDIGAQVQFSDVNSLLGRLGTRFVRTWSMTELFNTSEPGVFVGWVRPNFWYEFMGDPTTQFSSATGFLPFAADLFGPTFELDGGFTAQISQNTAVYADVSYLVGVGGSAGGEAYDGKIGMKVGW